LTMDSKKEKKALGRGLSALLGAQAAEAGTQIAAAGDGSSVSMLPIDKIKAMPNQPRRSFDDKALHELAQSIKEEGLLQPLLVREIKGGDKYELIIGERRFRACKIAGLQKIPAIIKSYSDAGAFKAALAENLQREDLNPIEIAIAYKRITEEDSLTQEQLSQIVGKDRSHVANHLRLLSLCDEVQKLTSEGALSFGHARAIVSLKDEADQKKAAERAIKEGLSVRKLETLITSMTTAVKPDLKKPAADPNTEKYRERVESKIKARFGGKARLSWDSAKKKGKIEIPVASIDALETGLKLLGVPRDEA